MRKRTQRISAILLSLAMVLTALPFHLVYADTGASANAPAVDETQGKTDAQENAKKTPEKAKETPEKKDVKATEEKIVTIKSVKVAYVNGKPLEDGHLISAYRSDKNDNGTDYEVKKSIISSWLQEFRIRLASAWMMTCLGTMIWHTTRMVMFEWRSTKILPSC